MVVTRVQDGQGRQAGQDLILTDVQVLRPTRIGAGRASVAVAAPVGGLAVGPGGLQPPPAHPTASVPPPGSAAPRRPVRSAHTASASPPVSRTASRPRGRQALPSPPTVRGCGGISRATQCRTSYLAQQRTRPPLVAVRTPSAHHWKAREVRNPALPVSPANHHLGNRCHGKQDPQTFTTPPAALSLPSMRW